MTDIRKSDAQLYRSLWFAVGVFSLVVAIPVLVIGLLYGIGVPLEIRWMALGALWTAAYYGVRA